MPFYPSRGLLTHGDPNNNYYIKYNAITMYNIIVIIFYVNYKSHFFSHFCNIFFNSG